MRLLKIMVSIGAVLAMGALAGCGGGGADGVASLGGKQKQQASKDGSSNVSRREREAAFRKFTQCMRDHGVEMQDPQIGDDGSFTITAQADAQAGTGPADPDFAGANKACNKYLARVINGGDTDGPSAAELEKIQRSALKFARCMRAAGFDFPDPQFESGNGGGGMVMIGGPGTSSIDPSDPATQAAMERCQKVAGMPKPSRTQGGAGGGGGTGPGLTVRGGSSK